MVRIKTIIEEKIQEAIEAKKEEINLDGLIVELFGRRDFYTHQTFAVHLSEAKKAFPHYKIGIKREKVRVTKVEQ